MHLSPSCRVVAWEPVPHFRAFFEYNIARNKLQPLIQVRAAVVTERPGNTYTVVVPQRGIWGTAGIDGANIDANVDNKGEYQQVGTQSVQLYRHTAKMEDACVVS